MAELNNNQPQSNSHLTQICSLFRMFFISFHNTAAVTASFSRSTLIIIIGLQLVSSFCVNIFLLFVKMLLTIRNTHETFEMTSDHFNHQRTKMMKTQQQQPISFPSTKREPPYKIPPVISRSETDNGHRDELETVAGRLKTFDSTWKNDKMPPETLAKAGFYFLKKGDAVKCPFCKVEGCQWEAGDDPMSDHMSWAPECSYVKQMSIKADSLAPSTTSSIDVCGNCEYLPNSAPEDETFKFLKNLGVEKTKPCSFEQYNNVLSRLQSYAQWPKSLKQKPDKLSEAGFFYKGVGDQTLCFHCGGGLKDWEDDDDPWEQHACWFPSCSYLLLSKGREYVEEVQRKFDPSAASYSATATKEKEAQVGEIQSSKDKDKDESNEVKEEVLPNDSRLCKICYKNELGVVFIPCGHVVACVDCSMSLKNICPVCRKKFDTVVRAFLQ